MTKEEIPQTFEEFKSECCKDCTANDWYCPSDCDLLIKARKMDFKNIQKSYERNDGDIVKVCRYINRKVVRK